MKLFKKLKTTVNSINTAYNRNWQGGVKVDAMALLTGSLKLYHLAANRWIIIRNCLNTGRQKSENTG